MGFETAVSGLRAAGADLGVIGNNIANAGTTGFKSSRAEFADVFATSMLGSSSNAIGSGVAMSKVTQTFAQGNISFTDNALDMAINGEGFFTMNDNGALNYTRAGSFQVDRDNYVVNNSGMRLMVFAATDTGEITGQTTDLRIDTSLIQPQATSDVDMTMNLDSGSVPPIAAFTGGFDAFAAVPTSPDQDMYNSSASMTVFDSLGNPHVQNIYFVKTANVNEWEVHTTIDGVSTSGPDVFEFESSGQIDPASLPLNINIAGWAPLNDLGQANGAAVGNITVDLSKATQFGSDFAVSSATQDGFGSGQLRGVEVGETGIVFARFTNGQSRALGQVILANFANPAGLQPQGDTGWAESFASGQPTLGAPGSAQFGGVQSGALEGSNVEITQQLVKMITAQRNFQANAQVIQTEDTITQTIINIR